MRLAVYSILISNICEIQSAQEFATRNLAQVLLYDPVPGPLWSGGRARVLRAGSVGWAQKVPDGRASGRRARWTSMEVPRYHEGALAKVRHSGKASRGLENSHDRQ